MFNATKGLINTFRPIGINDANKYRLMLALFLLIADDMDEGLNFNFICQGHRQVSV